MAEASTDGKHAFPVISACGDGRKTHTKETHEKYNQS
jgi:hypothetical protein